MASSNSFYLDFVGIGAQRCATTWIAECLREHPEICFSSTKELSFFDGKKYDFGLEWYARHFSCGERKIKGEYSPGYFLSPLAAERLKTCFPDVKLIVCLRNPIDRALSHHVYGSGYKKTQTPFDEIVHTQSPDLEKGLYFKHLAKYFELFPKDQFLILFYEDIKINPTDFMQRIYRFLGVSVDFTPKHLHDIINPPVQHRSVRLNYVLETLTTWARRYKVGLSLVNLLKKIGGKRAYNYLLDLNTAGVKKRPEIGGEVRKHLQAYYADDINRLQACVGRDLSHWK